MFVDLLKVRVKAILCKLNYNKRNMPIKSPFSHKKCWNNSFIFYHWVSNFTLMRCCSSLFMPHLAVVIQFNDSVVPCIAECQNVFHATSVVC